MGSYCACTLSWPPPELSICGAGQKDRSSGDENETGYSFPHSLIRMRKIKYFIFKTLSNATFVTRIRISYPAHFPAVGAGYKCLLRVLIGSLDKLSLLWLARVIALVLVLRHSVENRKFYWIWNANTTRRPLLPNHHGGYLKSLSIGQSLFPSALLDPCINKNPHKKAIQKSVNVVTLKWIVWSHFSSCFVQTSHVC